MATAKAITVAFEMAKPGDSEKEIAKNMMNLIIEYGAERIAHVALGAGQNVLETHHIPDSYRIKEGDLLHVDIGGFFNGYVSDISRMAVVGEPSRTQLEAYDIAVQTEKAAAQAMRPGTKIIDVHNATKEFYESKGQPYKRVFIGHSLGIGVHEYPFIGPSHGDWVLEENMFFQLEPGFIIGGMRVHTEDSFIVMKESTVNVSEYRDVSELQVVR